MVWPEPRVTVKNKLRSALHEQCLLALPAAQLFLTGLFPAARGELVVVQLGMGRKDGVGRRPNNVSILLLYKVPQRPPDELHLNCEGKNKGIACSK